MNLFPYFNVVTVTIAMVKANGAFAFSKVSILTEDGQWRWGS